ncbi:MAG: GYD domain-containing protein [Acidimicrobiales bacterium]
MATYLQLIRFTDQGAKGILEEGAAARIEAAKTALESIGCTLRDYWYVAGGPWHVAALYDGPADLAASAARGGLQITAAGAASDFQILQLVEGSNLDEAADVAYRPPGQ